MLDFLGGRVWNKRRRKHEILVRSLHRALSSWLFIMSYFLPPTEKKSFLLLMLWLEGKKEGVTFPLFFQLLPSDFRLKYCVRKNSLNAFTQYSDWKGRVYETILKTDGKYSTHSYYDGKRRMHGPNIRS